jgi:hypothetical protein
MAGLTTTQTFSDGDTVTAAKLNNIISNCTIDDDAVVTAKIDDDAVTLANMDTDSVDTDQLVDLAVSNTKLTGMTRGTVKVGDSSGAASDLDAKTDNAFLSGDGTDIKSKTFDSAVAGDIEITSTSSDFYLEIASDSIANAMVKNDAINPAKISHSSDSKPGVIIYGSSGVPAELTRNDTPPAVLTSAGTGAPSWKTHNKTFSMGNVPAAGSYVLAAHGCGAAPISLDFFLQCTTAEHNFSIGDRLWKKASYWSGSVCTFGADGTNVWYATHATNSLSFYDKPGGASGTSPSPVTLTAASWDLYAVVGT